MTVKLNSTSSIKAHIGIEPNGRVQRFFTHTCRSHMDKYVPFDTGTLARTVEEQPNKIIYTQEYAKAMYNGVVRGKNVNYHTDKHPLATHHWDRQMASAEMQDIVKEVENYIGGRR